MKALKKTGIALYYGIMANQGLNLDLLSFVDFVLQGKKFLGVSIQNWWFGSKTVEQRKEIFAEVMDLVATGKMSPKTGSVFDFNDIEAALKQTLTPDRQGKVMLVPRKK